MKFDVIIIGGGMVGTALACALSQGPWQIALVDDAAEKNREDTRLIALNDGSCRLFKNSGMWSFLVPHAAPIQQIHVSHRGHFGITHIKAQELGLDALGYVVPAHAINMALLTALNNAKNVKLICPAVLKAITQDTDTVTALIDTREGKQEYTADILIGADGSHSTVRELAGISTKKIDYQQSALVTVTELRRDHKNMAYERFQEQGAIAMLPLIGLRMATIWTAPNESITHLLQLDDTEFLRELQQCFGYRLGRLQQTGKRAVYPLIMQQAKERKKQNILLVGNAAQTLHPIAAQGFNLALYETALLTDYLLMQTSLKKCLQAFPTDSFQQKFSQFLSHGLVGLFSKDFFLLNAVRQTAMIAFDQCVPLKKQFTSYAMGQSGATYQQTLIE